MSAQEKARPIIIKRKKVVAAAGHHGGAWKVAYADFVTAMMAFFMLMWLLNATTEQQRKGLADYFSPTIPISRTSGGGDGSFGGDSVFSEDTLPQNGTGASAERPTQSRQARGETGASDSGEAIRVIQDEVLKSVEADLRGHGGQSTLMENEQRHVTSLLTDEGLTIEIFALEDAPIFEADAKTPTPLLRSIVTAIAEAARIVTNGISIAGHVQAQPIVVANNSTWDRSAEQANTTRKLFEELGMDPLRIKRVTGHADREPVILNTMAIRNNRLEIIFLRD